jgi:hypothetical protein
MNSFNDELFNEKLNLDELCKKQKITHEHKIKIYQRILARVHKKIKSVSRQRHNNKFCIYLLPEFVLGIPRYDMVNCTSFVIEKLMENGFQVKYTHPNLLFISWQHYIPSHVRADYKKKTGVSIDGYGNVIKKSNKNNPESKSDINALLLTNKSNNIKIKKDDKKSNFTNITTYKPTGNLIYNNKLIESIENTAKNDVPELKKIKL